MTLMVDVIGWLESNWSNIVITLATGLLTILAYLGWRDSRRGPDVWLATDESVELRTTVDVQITPDSHMERMFFRVRLTFVNYGPRAGALISLQVNLNNSLPNYVELQSSLSSGGIPSMQSLDYSPVSIEAQGALGLMDNLTLVMNDKDKSLLQLLREAKEFTVNYTYKVVVSKGKTKQRTSKIIVRPMELNQQIRKTQ